MTSVREWLHGVGLGELSEQFELHQIDLDAVRYLSDADFEELGLSMGARLKQPGGLPCPLWYSTAQTMEYVLRKCGDNLSRENLLRQATSLDQVELPMLLPGIRMTTSSTDYLPIEQMQLMRFDGTHWVRFGEVLSKR